MSSDQPEAIESRSTNPSADSAAQKLGCEAWTGPSVPADSSPSAICLIQDQQITCLIIPPLTDRKPPQPDGPGTGGGESHRNTNPGPDPDYSRIPRLGDPLPRSRGQRQNEPPDYNIPRLR